MRTTTAIAAAFLTAFLGAAVQAAPPQLPGTVASDLKAIAEECNGVGGRAMTDAAVRLADLNADGRDDYVLFVGWIGCEGAASAYGDRAKEVRVYAGDGAGGASKAFADVAYDAQIQGTGKDAKLWLSVSGMNCGKKPAATFAEEAFCERPVAWNAKAGKFEFAPVSAIKTIQ